jgi:hypothetical protein
MALRKVILVSTSFCVKVIMEKWREFSVGICFAFIGYEN